MSRLGLVATIVPLIIVAIGLIGWILTLRNDVTGTGQQVDGFHEELSSIHQRIGDDVTGLHERIDDTLEAAGAVEQKLLNRITELEKSLAVAADQQLTIMGDHEIFKDALRELGESGALPSGERRAYGGYGN